MIDLLCVAGSFACALVLFSAWLRHLHWWLIVLAAGVFGTSVYIALSVAVRQVGRQGIIEYGINPTSALRGLLLLAIATVILQAVGMAGCCFHFIFRGRK